MNKPLVSEKSLREMENLENAQRLVREEENRLENLANFGFTQSGAAIVEAIWFNGTVHTVCSGIVLICNRVGVWKAYLGGLIFVTNSKLDARIIAENGAKVPYAIAAAAFPGRFTEEEYDQ